MDNIIKCFKVVEYEAWESPIVHGRFTTQKKAEAYAKKVRETDYFDSDKNQGHRYVSNDVRVVGETIILDPEWED